MIEAERTVLWSSNSVAPNNTSITLSDSIDNYDELLYYGSGTRTYTPCVITEYPVISGVLNLGGPYFIGKWGANDTWLLSNGTQVFLSGNSGFVASSYFWGKTDGGTTYNASIVNNRVNDVRPFKIIGVKYPKNYDRSLIWSSDHTQTLYNTNITLSEPITHFRNFVVLGSGFENGGVGCRHASKNIYNVIPLKVQGCDAWAYTPWKLQQKHNLLIGQEMRISGNSGYIGSGYYFGMGNQTTAWAAGKWNADYQFSATAPYAIFGLNRKPKLKFKSIPTPGGSVSASINPGYEYDVATITAVPKGDEWKVSAIDISGATLTGNEFMYENTNVSAKAEFEHSRDLTLINDEHATLSADKMSGFSGDVVTVDATTDEGWYFTGLNVTGAVATGNKFMFIGENVTAEGLYTDEGFPVTYLADEHVHLTGDSIYIPGSEGITLDSGYDTYYRISGYDITNGSIVDGKLVATGPCTIKAVQKVNAFTASGTFDLPASTTTAWRYGVRSYGKLTYKTSNVTNNLSATRNNTWYTGATGSTGRPTTVYNNTTITAFVPTGAISAYKLHIYATVSAGRGVSDGRTITAESYVYVNNSYKTSARSYSVSRSTGWSKNYNVDYSNTGDFFLSAWQNYGNGSKININPKSWSATGYLP